MFNTISKKIGKFLTSKKIVIAIWAIELLILLFLLFIIRDRILESNFNKSERRYFLLTIYGMIVLFFITVLFDYREAKKHLSAFLTISLIYTTLLIGFAIYLPKPAVLLIPQLKAGTFGLRSWKCKVEIPFDSLEVFYLNERDHWMKISPTILRDSNNWIKYQYIDDPKIDLKKDSIVAQFTNTAILIENCGIVFYPKDKSLRREYSDIMSPCTNFDPLYCIKSDPPCLTKLV